MMLSHWSFFSQSLLSFFISPLLFLHSLFWQFFLTSVRLKASKILTSKKNSFVWKTFFGKSFYLKKKHVFETKIKKPFFALKKKNYYIFKTKNFFFWQKYFFWKRSLVWKKNFWKKIFGNKFLSIFLPLAPKHSST